MPALAQEAPVRALGGPPQVINYAGDDDPAHELVAYMPRGVGPFPAMVLIHGGGWANGGPQGMGAVAREYALQGVASFSIGYVLSTPDEPSWPQNIQDVVCAVRHIRANAETYRIDPGRIAAFGYSAGAHLAGLLGVLEGDEPFLQEACGDPTVSIGMTFVVSRSGPLDLSYIGITGDSIAVDAVGQYLGATYAENPARWDAASPLTYIDPGDPPYLQVHGSLDRTVPVESAISFAEHFRAIGGESTLMVVDGAAHDVPLPADLPELQELIQRFLSF